MPESIDIQTRPVAAEPAPRGRPAVVAAVCAMLTMAVVLVFAQTARHDFVNYDDDRYVYDNEHLSQGFTPEGLLYYLYHWHSYTYHPVTTYSHMLDCQLFGLKPGGHHAVNVALHAATAVLLLLVVRQMTGRLWPSAMVAALFALHPLRVESVAWISERKDVLSGLFFVLTLGAYVRYVREPAAEDRRIDRRTHLAPRDEYVGAPSLSGKASDGPPLPPGEGRGEGTPICWRTDSMSLQAPAPLSPTLSRRERGTSWIETRCLAGPKGCYLAVCVLFGLGLLAKPMLVTVPMLLLLLDYWPLGRWRRDNASVNRSVPSLPTEVVPGSGDERNHEPAPGLPCSSADSVGQVANLPADEQPSDRTHAGDATQVGQAAAPCLASSGFSPEQTAAPARRQWFPWRLVAEKIPLFLLSLLASALTVHTQVGAIQSIETVSWWARLGNVSVAYASYLGCFFWPQGLAVLYPHRLDNLPVETALKMAGLLAVVTVLVLASWKRMPFLLVGWLWYLGMLVPVIGLVQVGGARMADRYTYLPQIGLALALVWTLTAGCDFLASRARTCGRLAEVCIAALASAGVLAALIAVAWWQTTFWFDSKSLWCRGMLYPNIVAHYNLGLALEKDGLHDEAIEQYQKALEIDPKDQDSLNNLGLVYETVGRIDKAIEQFQAVLRVNPKAADANNNLGRILHDQGDDRAAMEHWRVALREDPKNSGLLQQAARLLATSPDDSVRDGAEALRLAEEAVRLTKGKSAAALLSQASARAESGDYAAAVADARAALELAAARDDERLVGEIREHLNRYESGKPFRQERRPAKSGVSGEMRRL